VHNAQSVIDPVTVTATVTAVCAKTD
jgi:hypothetical protein